MNDLFHRLPKSELHVHLGGAAPVETLTELINRHVAREPWRGEPPDLRARLERRPNIRPFLSPARRRSDEVAALLRTDSFEQFLDTFYFTSLFVREADDLRLLLHGVLDQFQRRNIVYAEVTVNVPGYLRRGLALEAVAECLDEAARDGRVRVQWIVDLIRDLGPAAALDLLPRLAGLNLPSLVGVTLGGSEHRFPPALFAAAYRRARELGFRLTVHAGEALGPESVWDALRLLGVERIGHGVRAVEDSALVRHLAERRIPLEICPTSNLRTGLYPSYAAHPVKALHAAGVPITLSTDDPTFFAVTLDDEYGHLADIGFSRAELLEILRNGFRFAFLPAGEIEHYLERLLPI